jgi:SAM-dependent methyltransferase
VTPETLAALRTPDGGAALAAARQVAGRQPAPAAGSTRVAGHDPVMAAASALRARGIEPVLAAAALTQVELRARAADKFGADAGRMFFTRVGLQQATRAGVAARRAARLAAGGVRHLADLCCGIGADALAAARAGIRVSAVDADPLTAAVARANADALGLAELVSVECADARDVDLSTVDGVYCDPDRRRGSTRVFDPRGYSPPWQFVSGLASVVPRTVLKLAPGIDHALVPAGVEAEWVSVRGEVVEAALWYGPLARVPRRATLLPEGLTLTGSGLERAPVGPVRRYLLDPDAAVVRAHLVAEFAATVGGTLADPHIAYVYADAPATAGFARCFEVLDALPFSMKRLRAALRERRVGRLTIKKRGSPLDPDHLRRQLRLSGDEELTLVLTRVAGAPTALLCRPRP